MSTHAVPGNDSATSASVPSVDMKLEVIVIPVSDVDRAKDFYSKQRVVAAGSHRAVIRQSLRGSARPGGDTAINNHGQARHIGCSIAAQP